jgi:hypothetical protein
MKTSVKKVWQVWFTVNMAEFEKIITSCIWRAHIQGSGFIGQLHCYLKQRHGNVFLAVGMRKSAWPSSPKKVTLVKQMAVCP